MIRRRPIIYRVAYAHAHTGDQLLVRLTAQVNTPAPFDIRRVLHALHSGGNASAQNFSQLCQLIVRQRLRTGHAYLQFFPRQQLQHVTGLQGKFFPGLLNKPVCQRLPLGCEFTLLQELARFLRRLADHLSADLFVHNSPQLPLPLYRTLAHRVGLLLPLGSGSYAVFLYLLTRLQQQLFLLPLCLLFFLLRLIRQALGILLRLPRALQLRGDLLLALPECPRDHFSRNEEQRAEQDQEISNRK